jgi:sec-independent protein translocase protein TatA
MPALLFLDISFGEIFIIVAVIFIIFGPQKIPEIARRVGKGVKEIKKASTDIRREINQEVDNYKTDLDMERMVNESDQKKSKDRDEKPLQDDAKTVKGTE